MVLVSIPCLRATSSSTSWSIIYLFIDWLFIRLLSELFILNIIIIIIIIIKFILVVWKN